MFRIAGFLLGVTLATLGLLTLIDMQRGEAIPSDATVQSPFLESPLPSRERATEGVQMGQGTERLSSDSLDRVLASSSTTGVDVGATDERLNGEDVGQDAPLLATATPSQFVSDIEAHSDTSPLDARVEPPQDEQTGTAVQGSEEMISAGIEDWDDADADAPVDAEGVSVVEAEVLPSVPDWHVFWSPFRSALSARGFAARLGRVTGAEFKVIEQGLGQYAVAFPYADETERLARLAEIQAETGLAVLEEE